MTQNTSLCPMCCITGIFIFILPLLQNSSPPGQCRELTKQATDLCQNLTEATEYMVARQDLYTYYLLSFFFFKVPITPPVLVSLIISRGSSFDSDQSHMKSCVFGMGLFRKYTVKVFKVNSVYSCM